MFLLRVALLLIDFPHIWITEHDPLHCPAQHHSATLLLHQHSHDAIQDVNSLLCWHPSLLSILLVGIHENGPLQGVPGEFPPAQPCTSFLAGIAVSVPVGLFSNLDCFSTSHIDTPGAGDKCVSELLQRPHFIRLQRFAVLQLAVALFQHSVVDALHLDLVQIQPQNTVNVSSSSPLELDTVADVSHLHGIVVAKDNLLPEGLHAMLEIACGKEDISLHHRVLLPVHMVSQVLQPGLLNGLLAIFHFDHSVVFAKLVHTIVYFAAKFFQFRGEVGTPPEIARGESEENLKGADVL